MSKEDKQHNITFSIDSDSEDSQITTGDGILSSIKGKLKEKSIVKKIKKEPKNKEQDVKIGKQKQPWKEFVKTRTEGKKFQSRQAVNDYMKQLSQDYKAL